jgi:hypothetical protein
MFCGCIPVLQVLPSPVLPALFKAAAIDGQVLASAFRTSEWFVNNQSAADLFRSFLVLAILILLLSELLHK